MKRISLVGNDCLGGVISGHQLHQHYNSVFAGVCVFPDEMNYLIDNFLRIDFRKIELSIVKWPKFMGFVEYKDDVWMGNIDNKVRFWMMHEDLEKNIEVIKDAYFRRLERMMNSDKTVFVLNNTFGIDKNFRITNINNYRVVTVDNEDNKTRPSSLIKRFDFKKIIDQIDDKYSVLRIVNTK